ncbi:MAG: hypothetical protein M9919_05615 [Burkholderiaceae bacterium]|nr:hypothetical protein [Burkholderiaceae bacterium]
MFLAWGPPLLLACVRAWLQWQDGRHPPTPAFPVAPLPVSDSVAALFLPWLLGAVALLLLAVGLGWWGQRGGARAVQRVLLALWALLWLSGAGALWVSHANTSGLAPLPQEGARVLGLRPRPPTLHQPGGTEVVLALATYAGPQRVRIDDERVTLWQPGQRLRVGLAQGRFYGLYLTGWDRLEPASQ